MPIHFPNMRFYTLCFASASLLPLPIRICEGNRSMKLPFLFMSPEKQRTMDKEAVSVEKKEEMNKPEYEHPVQVSIVWAV